MWARVTAMYSGFLRRLFWRYGGPGYALAVPAGIARRAIAVGRRGEAKLRLI